LAAAGVQEIAVFHSSSESLRRYHADLPFAIVPDPERRLYALYGLEKGLAALLHPKAMWAGMKGLFSAPNNPLDAEGGMMGLPGDFLINADGKIVLARYGSHADDHLVVDDVLKLAGQLSKA
jgi:peroxiredoxin